MRKDHDRYKLALYGHRSRARHADGKRHCPIPPRPNVAGGQGTYDFRPVLIRRRQRPLMREDLSFTNLSHCSALIGRPATRRRPPGWQAVSGMLAAWAIPGRKPLCTIAPQFALRTTHHLLSAPRYRNRQSQAAASKEAAMDPPILNPDVPTVASAEPGCNMPKGEAQSTTI